MLTASPPLTFAIDQVAQSCRLTIAEDRIGIFYSGAKADGTIVTHLDFAVQAFIGSQLQDSYPAHGFIGEEESTFLRNWPALLQQATATIHHVLPGANESDVLEWIATREGGSPTDPFWILDPIDSTRGFLTGAAYSIQLAGIWDGKVQVAVMGHPRALHNRTPAWMARSALLFLAARGHGAWWSTLDDPDTLQPLRVSSRPLKDAVRLRAPQSAYSGQSAHDMRLRDLVTQELVTTHEIPCGSTVRYPLLALGEGDLLLRLMLSSRTHLYPYAWDQAAGSLLVEEAGGRVTDLDGRPLDFTAGRTLSNNRGLIASNGVIHDEVIAAIHQAEATHRAEQNDP